MECNLSAEALAKVEVAQSFFNKIKPPVITRFATQIRVIHARGLDYTDKAV